ncbi:shematrin-like protein 2 isoform X2 [Saccostrea cucullata]|uniref:shematrin-like protein 2 isoform X2 n=1 Tax=Saccostrea cuccullata TaxID=36930 RepID=UPI002ED425DB
MIALVLLVSVALCSADYDKKNVYHPGGGVYPPVGGVYPPVGGGGGGVYPPFVNKPGTCSNFVNTGDLGRPCYSDYWCPGVQKCCYISYSSTRVCQVPREYQKPFGSCPPHPNTASAGNCNHDYNCGGSYKCCRGISGNIDTCAYPVHRGFGLGGVGGVGPVGPLGGVGGLVPVGGVGGVGPVGGVVGGPGVVGSVGGLLPGGVYPKRKSVY